MLRKYIRSAMYNYDCVWNIDKPQKHQTCASNCSEIVCCIIITPSKRNVQMHQSKDQNYDIHAECMETS